MVLAAATRRIPSALTEADAHLGLANRLAAPFARRVFLSYPIPGRGGAKYRVVGQADPASLACRRRTRTTRADDSISLSTGRSCSSAAAASAPGG